MYNIWFKLENDKRRSKNSNKKNVLLNALGVNPSVYYDEQIIDNNYDALLLCSDGLYNMVSLEELNKIMYLNISVEEKVKSLSIQPTAMVALII